jgi:hypothetical protein
MIPRNTTLKVIGFWYVNKKKRPIVDGKKFEAGGEIKLKPNEFRYLIKN